jgi:hypothetical protein
MESFFYIVNHVFLPPKLPQKDDYQSKHAQALCLTVHKSLKQFIALFCSESATTLHQRAVWHALLKMTEKLCAAEPVSKNTLKRSISTMEPGGLFSPF